MSNGQNPFELGEQHAKAELGGAPRVPNPYDEFSAKWALYNHGYNVTRMPEYFNRKKD